MKVAPVTSKPTSTTIPMTAAVASTSSILALVKPWEVEVPFRGTSALNAGRMARAAVGFRLRRGGTVAFRPGDDSHAVSELSTSVGAASGSAAPDPGCANAATTEEAPGFRQGGPHDGLLAVVRRLAIEERGQSAIIGMARRFSRARAAGSWPPPLGTPPVIAARRSIVAVAGVALFALSAWRSGSKKPGAAGATSTTTEPTTIPPSTSAPTSAAATAPHSAPNQPAATPAGGPVPAGFQSISFSAISDTEWRLLGDAACSHKPCTSIVRTTDGGAHFVGIPAPTTALYGGIADPTNPNSVRQLAFADPMDGFAYETDLWATTTVAPTGIRCP